MLASERKYAVSVITLLPLSRGRKGPERAYKYAQELGLGLQLVPFASWPMEAIAAIPPESVISYEGAWSNAPFTVGSYINSILDHRDAASVAEPFLFGFSRRQHERHKEMVKLFSTQFPHAFPIDVEIENSLKEISPNHPWALSHYLNSKAGLVLDTWHIREWYAKNMRSEPLELFIRSLLPKIRLIHFQTRDDAELDQFLTLQGPLYHIMNILKDTPDGVPVVIELHPKHQKKLEAILRCLQISLEH